MSVICEPNWRATLAAAVVCLISFAASVAAEAGTPEPPNVLIVLADDLGYGDLGSTGAPYVQTPHLDAFAASSITFTSAYAPSPQCSPTRGAILTGQYPARLHITTWIGGNKALEYKGLKLPQQRTKLPEDIYSLAEYFQSAGYETAQIGKWHLGGDPKGPARLGFEHTVGFAGGAGPGKGREWFGPYPKVRDLDGPPEEYITERLTTEAVAFLEEDRDRPFFMMFQHYDPHAPLVAPDQDVQRYVDVGRPESEGKLNATYLAMVEHVDRSFGRLIAALDAQGQLEQTVIIFFSDNGATTWHGRNEPFRAGKKEFYEGGIRVPMFMHVPGSVLMGQASDVPVNGIDFFPTLVELTGGDVASVASTLDGVSLVPVIHGAEALERDTLFWHHPALSRHYADIPPQGAVRKGPWKLIDFYGDIRADELYHLVDDPSETTNLAQSHPERVETMRELLRSHLEEVGAQMVTPMDNSPD
ncbi:MAG: sulfatase [Planctomycetota bacterium]